MYTYFDGESGGELVRLSRSVVDSCSGPGRQDSNVARALASGEGIEWLADDAVIRRYLESCGAWDSDDLGDPDDNRARCLWLACCDIAENPELYR